MRFEMNVQCKVVLNKRIQFFPQNDFDFYLCFEAMKREKIRRDIGRFPSYIPGKKIHFYLICLYSLIHRNIDTHIRLFDV